MRTARIYYAGRFVQGRFSISHISTDIIFTEVLLIATTRLMPLHVGRGSTIASTLAGSLDYVEDPGKTQDGEYISSYECDAKTADAEFLLSKSLYKNLTGRDQGDNNVIAYHVRQSFRPGEITPEEANRIGYELAMRFTKGKHAFVVCTHVDRHHIHSHIIWNSTALDCRSKFRNFIGSSFALRRVSDRLCLEHSLSVVENPKPSRGHYGRWLGDRQKPSFQSIIRLAIEEALDKKPTDFDAFLKLLEEQGIEVLRDKRLRFKAPGQKKPTRCDTLKGEYAESVLRERISGRQLSRTEQTIAAQPESFGLLIDVQKIIQSGKGPGYERWAKLFNLKQAAETLIYLQEHELDNYSLLSEKAAEASARSNALTERVKELDHVLTANANLQKQIVNYSKTREVYSAYRQAGYSRKFLSEHAGEMELHKTAKQTFDKLGLTKLPTVKALRSDYAEQLALKKKAYAEYKTARSDMRELLNAKLNVDVLLGLETNRQTQRGDDAQHR